MANSAILAIKIIADASQASKGFDQASTRAGKFGEAMKRAAIPAAAVGTALLAAGKVAVKSASDQEQAFGGVEAVFGRYSDTVKASAKTAAGSAGLSATAYAEMAARIGGQLKAAGVPMDKIAGQTDELIGRAADLATTYGGTTVDAVESLSAAFRGEGDSAEKYNLQLSASAVQAELAAKGQDKLTGAALAQAKVQATQALIFKQSGDAAGQFAQQTDSLAEKQQIAKANMDNTAATLGQVLLPIVGAVTDQLGKLATWIGKNATLVQTLAGVIGGLAAVILTITAAMRVYAIVQGIVNAVIAANPVVLITLAIIALIVVVVLLVKNWKTVAKVAGIVWKAITAAAKAAGRAVASAWSAVYSKLTAAARAVGRFVSAAFRGIASVAKTVASAIRSAWNAAFRFISSAIRAAVAGWKAAIRGVVAVAKAVASGIRTAWNAAFRFITSAIRAEIAGWKAIIRGVATAAKAVASTIKNTVIGAFRAVSSFIRGLHIPNPFAAIMSVINTLIGKVQSLISWLGRIKVPSIKIPGIGSVGGSSVSSAPAVATYGATLTARGGVSGRSTATAGAGGDTYVINAPLGDGDQVARSLDLILSRRARRTGGVRRIGTRLPLVSGA